MDFSRIPDPVFLKIYDYLPFEDGIRLGRVNKIFRRIAQLAISQTKSLDLSEGRFRNLNGDQLAVILDMCSSNLERIKFPSRNAIDVPSTRNIDWDSWNKLFDILDNQGRQLATIFSNYRCPRLIDIDLGAVPIDYAVFGFVPIDNANFDRLIRNNPNIECFVWKRFFVGFPDITYNNLKKLKVFVYNSAALQSMIGRCPNLKELDLDLARRCADANLLDEFFGSVPQVNQIRLDLSFGDAQSDIIFRSELVNFRNLPITSLKIYFPHESLQSYSGDSVLFKLATTFPHLRNLYLYNLEPTSAGVAALAALQDLEILDLGFIASYPSNGQGQYEQGIRQLVHCKKLQKLSMVEANISAGTLVNLFRRCPQLERVEIFGITEVANPGEAVVVLESLAGIAQREITIKFYCGCYTFFIPIWKTEPVKYVIRKLEEIDGLKIKITLYEQWIGYLDDYMRRRVH